MGYFKEQKSPMDRLNERIDTIKNVKSLKDPTRYETNIQNRHLVLADSMAKNMEKMYDNERLGSSFDRFKEYYNDNLDSMDENTMEIFQYLKDDYVERYEINSEFIVDKNRLKMQNQEIMQMVDNYDNAFRKTDFTADEIGGNSTGFINPVRRENETDESFTLRREDYEAKLPQARALHYRNTQNQLKEYTMKFKEFETDFNGKYYDRINGFNAPFSDLSDTFDNQKEMLSFLWQAAETDGAIDKSEHRALQHYMDTGSLDEIEKYDTKLQEFSTRTAIDQQESMEKLNEKITMMQQALDDYDNDIPTGGVYYDEDSGEEIILKRDMENNKQQKQVLRSYKELQGRLQRSQAYIVDLNKKYMGFTGLSFLDSLQSPNQKVTDYYNTYSDNALGIIDADKREVTRIDAILGEEHGFPSNLGENADAIIEKIVNGENIETNEENIQDIKNRTQKELDAEENEKLFTASRQSGKKSYTDINGNMQSTQYSWENEAEWARSLRVWAPKGTEVFSYQFTYDEFYLPSASQIVQDHQLYSDNPDSKPILEEIVEAIKPGLHNSKAITNSYSNKLSSIPIDALMENPVTYGLKIADKKNQDEIYNWFWDIFVGSHPSSGGKNMRIFKRSFWPAFMKYIAYANNPEFGAHNSKTKQAYRDLQKSYDRMSIGAEVIEKDSKRDQRGRKFKTNTQLREDSSLHEQYP